MTPSVETVARTDAGLASELRVSVLRLSRRLRAERTSDNELGVAAISALGVLFRVGEVTIGELAANECVQPPSMTRTVNCLVDKGFAVRRAHEGDRRQVLIDISEKGRETILADRKLRTAWLARQFKGMTAEERAILRAAAPLLDRLGTA
jgi:DNA-binding MarR family transcriptional regulator